MCHSFLKLSAQKEIIKSRKWNSERFSKDCPSHRPQNQIELEDMLQLNQLLLDLFHNWPWHTVRKYKKNCKMVFLFWCLVTFIMLESSLYFTQMITPQVKTSTLKSYSEWHDMTGYHIWFWVMGCIQARPIFISLCWAWI